MENLKMKDSLIDPIADYSQTLADIIHKADVATFRMQAAAQFDNSPEFHAKWKRQAKQSMMELRKAVKALSDEIAAI